MNLQDMEMDIPILCPEHKDKICYFCRNDSELYCETCSRPSDQNFRRVDVDAILRRFGGVAKFREKVREDLLALKDKMSVIKDRETEKHLMDQEGIIDGKVKTFAKEFENFKLKTTAFQEERKSILNRKQRLVEEIDDSVEFLKSSSGTGDPKEQVRSILKAEEEYSEKQTDLQLLQRKTKEQCNQNWENLSILEKEFNIIEESFKSFAKETRIMLDQLSSNYSKGDEGQENSFEIHGTAGDSLQCSEILPEYADFKTIMDDIGDTKDTDNSLAEDSECTLLNKNVFLVKQSTSPAISVDDDEAKYVSSNLNAGQSEIVKHSSTNGVSVAKEINSKQETMPSYEIVMDCCKTTAAPEGSIELSAVDGRKDILPSDPSDIVWKEKNEVKSTLYDNSKIIAFDKLSEENEGGFDLEKGEEKENKNEKDNHVKYKTASSENNDMLTITDKRDCLLEEDCEGSLNKDVLADGGQQEAINDANEVKSSDEKMVAKEADAVQQVNSMVMHSSELPIQINSGKVLEKDIGIYTSNMNLNVYSKCEETTKTESSLCQTQITQRKTTPPSHSEYLVKEDELKTPEVFRSTSSNDKNDTFLPVAANESVIDSTIDVSLGTLLQSYEVVGDVSISADPQGHISLSSVDEPNGMHQRDPNNVAQEADNEMTRTLPDDKKAIQFEKLSKDIYGPERSKKFQSKDDEEINARYEIAGKGENDMRAKKDTRSCILGAVGEGSLDNPMLADKREQVNIIDGMNEVTDPGEQNLVLAADTVERLLLEADGKDNLDKRVLADGVEQVATDGGDAVKNSDEQNLVLDADTVEQLLLEADGKGNLDRRVLADGMEQVATDGGHAIKNSDRQTPNKDADMVQNDTATFSHHLQGHDKNIDVDTVRDKIGVQTSTAKLAEKDIGVDTSDSCLECYPKYETVVKTELELSQAKINTVPSHSEQMVKEPDRKNEGGFLLTSSNDTDDYSLSLLTKKNERYLTDIDGNAEVSLGSLLQAAGEYDSIIPSRSDCTKYISNSPDTLLSEDTMSTNVRKKDTNKDLLENSVNSASSDQQRFRSFNAKVARNRMSRGKPDVPGVCEITGSAFMPDGRLVLCDRQNSKLKLFDVDFSILDTFEFKDRDPLDVTFVNGPTVAVSSKDLQIITFVDIEQNIERISGEIDMPSCRPVGVAYGSECGNLMVTCSVHKGVHICECKYNGQNWHGTIMKTIPERITQNEEAIQELFINPSYLATDKHGKMFYISDDERDVKCVSADGNEIWTTGGKLNETKGVAIYHGKLLVCGSNNIYEVDIETGNVTSDILPVNELHVCDPRTVVAMGTCVVVAEQASTKFHVFQLA